ncbi:MAG: hypothetical protein WD598_18020 [Acidimicrobiia bacterium]
MQLLLVHSPATGPAPWNWVAACLTDAGNEVVLPNLTPAAESGDPVRFAQMAAAAVSFDGSVVICGHSGAGPLLPLVAAQLARPPELVAFIDAGLPPCSGSFVPDQEFLVTLKGLAHHGVLPPWSQWWGDDVLEALVSDPERRSVVAARLPRVPLQFYEQRVLMPPDWCDLHCGYILSSDAYRNDAQRAAAHGWPVREHLGQHLDIVNEPERYAQLVTSLVEDTTRN